MTLHELQRRVNKVDIIQIAADSVEATKDAIKKLNQGQLFIGKRADGTTITPEYTAVTEMIKNMKGQPSDRVTLRDTGAFWDSITVHVSRGTYTITATDPKTEKLVDKYGEAIIGLSEESKNEEYIPLYFGPEFRRRFSEATKLIF